MQSKERIMNVLRGKEVDRVPVCPYVAYWWEHQTDEFTAQGELGFLESVGSDPLFRGHWPMNGKDYEEMALFRKEIADCEIKEVIEGNKKNITYHTPIGDLTLGYLYTPVSDSWFLVDHPVAEEEDFLVLQHIMKNTKLIPEYERFNKVYDELGERGVLVPLVSPESKSSFQSLLEKWCGTENLVYALMDFPEVVEDTLKIMYERSMEGARICAASRAEVFETYEDTSTTNISPQFYRDYILPEINGWCEILHASGKLYLQHACGTLDQLLEDIAGSKIDALESLTPAPMGDVKMERAAEVIPQHMAVIGGYGGIQFLEDTEDEVEEGGRRLLKIMKGKRFILGNSDSCPPGVSVEKFRRLVKVAKEG